jgi:hypothetical protein
MRIKKVITAPRSPWQNAFAERMIGSIRRECPGQVIALGEKNHRATIQEQSPFWTYVAHPFHKRQIGRPRALKTLE